GHLDGRRGDRRILSDGQIENGHAAQQHSDARDDIREHRAFYEEFSEHLFHALALFLRSAHVWRMTKKAGTKRTARQVEANIPLPTAMPRERRALAPAPLASTSGSTPRMKVKEVIMIGRKRTWEAAMVASRILLPAARPSRAISTIKIAFLAESAMSRTSP